MTINIEDLKAVSCEDMVKRWTGPDRPKFNNTLIEVASVNPWSHAIIPVCRCAQGDVLFTAGMADEELENLDQNDADWIVADLLGIELFHSILLRAVNDRKTDCPEDVLRDPGKIFGRKEWPRICNLWEEVDDKGNWEMENLQEHAELGDSDNWSADLMCFELTYMMGYAGKHQMKTYFSDLGELAGGRLFIACIYEIYLGELVTERWGKFHCLELLGFKEPGDLDTKE